jgi:mono/diheme cytochrome c family protein
MGACALAGGALFNVSASSQTSQRPARPQSATRQADLLVRQGRQVFRFDDFGDDAFWGGALQLHRAIEGAAHGGVGAGVSPKTALAVGLKVDVNALPGSVRSALKAGKVNLNSPATTLALLKLNAVVGLKGHFNRRGTLSSVGITCAVCHSTVNNSFAPGIGQRLDGWPNRDLNVGAIVSLAPNLKPVTDLLGVDAATVKKVLAAWGPGKFDAELFLDGKGFQPDGRSAATLIPPAYGLAGVNLHTYTGWGSIPYWNAFVANLEMHGQGDFTDARLDDAAKFPVAARNRMGHTRVHGVPDRIRSKLPALHAYQLSLRAPKPRRGSFDRAAARRGKRVFDGKGRCASCHMPPTFTDPGWNLHAPGEICTDSFQASRSPTNGYRTTPLGGLGTRTRGGYYHDGRYATLSAVVNHYDSCMNLGLTPSQKTDLVQFLRSR